MILATIAIVISIAALGLSLIALQLGRSIYSALLTDARSEPPAETDPYKTF